MKTLVNAFARAIARALRSLRHIVVPVLLLATASAAEASNYTDHYWNKDESGWGLTLAHHNDKVFGVWYVYDVDGKPFWVVMPDGTFSADKKRFSGAIYRTTGPAYNSEIFSSSQVNVTRAGNATLEFSSDDNSVKVTYTIGSVTTTKTVTRQPFGDAPANPLEDYSDLWWNPLESGWGLAITQHGDNIFAVWYTYAADGRPLWVVLPGGQFTDPKTFTGKLYTTTGTPYSALRFSPLATQVEEVGVATLQFMANEATFTSTVRGFTQTKRIVRQGFGAPPALNQRPDVSLAITGGSNAVAPASITLNATASDPDGRIAKVMFYSRCEKIGEVTAAPYRMPVANLPAGTHAFSAEAVDDRGAIRIATATVEVKSTTPPPPTNQPPAISIATPASNTVFTLGDTVQLTANASDPDGTVAKVEYFANAVKVGEAAASPWSASWTPPGGGYNVTAVATDDKGLMATSAAVAISVSSPPVVVDAATRDAARFLVQATFGIKGTAEIDSLRNRGYPAWLDEQFATTAASHVQYVNDRAGRGDPAREERAYEAIWQQWLNEPGQLRARMSFALSEIFVISNIAPDLNVYAMTSYMDMLNRNAFGNYRQLLEDVTLHAAMGYYLNMIGSKKADPVKGTHPNENYAREVMQLFSIGLYKLNQDGTRQLDAQGQPIPTYDQSVVGAMAAAFSGWNFAGNDTSSPEDFDPAKENWLDPLVPWEMLHDTGAKTIFNGIALPAGQSARKDMKDVLDALYNHPNVGPFIGRELIQRFVTSNPSPAYISRVAATFNDNGQGVRGDLKAVIRAVLLDPDARDLAKTDEPAWGKQREPVIRFANFLRAFNATSTSGRNHIWYLDSAEEGLNQSPLLSPSVFNFFSPNYRQPGPLSAAGLVAPEFQITTETSMVGGLNFFARLVRRGYYGDDDTRLTMDVTELNALASDPAALADKLKVLLLAGRMSPELRANIITTLGAMQAKWGTDHSAVTDRVQAALILIAVSPEFAIQR